MIAEIMLVNNTVLHPDRQNAGKYDGTLSPDSPRMLVSHGICLAHNIRRANYWKPAPLIHMHLSAL